MHEPFVLRGVPASLVEDGWWLGTAAAPPANPDHGDAPGMSGHSPRPALWLILVVLADQLFWGHAPGLSLALFAAAIFAAAVWTCRPSRMPIRQMVVLALGALPVIDYVQPLSIAFLGASLIAALVWMHRPEAGVAALTRAASSFLLRLPGEWLMPLRPRVLAGVLGGLRKPASGAVAQPRLRLVIRNWAFPLGGTLVFTALLLDANPILARILTFEGAPETFVSRAFFWIGTALLIAPFVRSDLAPEHAGLRLPSGQRLPRLGVNAGSVLRALVLFNLLIGLQVVTDMSILIGGASLPPGLSYADYAHRGAYPLLATAILAGAFALAANPFLAENRLLRPLMLLWLAQNVALCAAAALRLDLYIATYGLTYLRLYALIWMALVAAGLGLCLWQALQGHPIRWMLLRAAGLGLATLYAASFVNMAQIVAAQNLTRARFDIRYICDLGPMAAGALAQTKLSRFDVFAVADSRVSCPAAHAPQIDAWQEWGFRKWQVNRYVARSAVAEQAE